MLCSLVISFAAKCIYKSSARRSCLRSMSALLSSMWLSIIKALIFFHLVNGWPYRRFLINDAFSSEQSSVKILKNWIEKRHLQLSLPRDGELFEGDMVMSSLLRRAVIGGFSKRSALVEVDHKWKNAIVPYELDKSLAKVVHTSIKNAIKEYNKYTCVRFVPRQHQRDYVLFRSEPHKCSSSVGKVGGEQKITLGRGCARLGTVLHEMMHALGIVHEQSRPDRDDHVEVLQENVKEKFMHNFRKYDFYDVIDLNVPYNFASVMHYRNTAFSKNGSPTLRSKHDPSLKFGQRKMFSEGDIAQINRLYSCNLKQETDLVETKRPSQTQTANDRSDVVPNAFDHLKKGNTMREREVSSINF